ncbi:putative ribonuclease H protein [Nymphaea thermarum]|nr:putative ribonuclease H protein [Nymphaea thermarum]
MQRMSAPCHYAVVAGLLGGSSWSGMDYSYVFQVLWKQWTMVRRPRFSVIGNGRFLIRVDNEEEIRSVLAKRAWKVGARTLIASRWAPGQEMKITEEQTVLLWIRLPGLHVNLWNEYSYQSMAKSINGVFVVSDQCTTKGEKLGFARIQLEVPVMFYPRPSIRLDLGEGRVIKQEIVYESRIIYCVRCGALTHLAANCRQKVDTNDSVYPEQSPWDKVIVRVKQKVSIKGGWRDNIPSQAHRTLHTTGREHKELVVTSPQASNQTKAIDQRRMLQSDDTEAEADLVNKKPPQKNLEGQDSESHPLLEPSHGTPETIIRSIALRTGFEGVASNQQQAEGIARITCFWCMGKLSALQCQAPRWWIELAFKIGDYNSPVKIFGVYLPNNPTFRSNCYCLLKKEINKNLYPVIMMGDCNAMSFQSDKTGRALNPQSCRLFNEFIYDSILQEIKIDEKVKSLYAQFEQVQLVIDQGNLSAMEGIVDGKMVSEEENDTLLSPITMEEVKQAVFGLDEDSAAGPDGRLCLVKHNLAISGVYWMQGFRLPTNTLIIIERKMVHFLWAHNSSSRAIHLIAWKDLCKPKEEGGVGLWALVEWNAALMATRCYKILEGNSLLALWLRMRYLRNIRSFWSAKKPWKGSWAWVSLGWGWMLIENLIFWKAGNGKKIRFWVDDWSHGILLHRVQGELYEQVEHDRHLSLMEAINYYRIG